jgi:hypothetical protein
LDNQDYTDYIRIDNFLSRQEDYLLTYSGAKYDNSFGLWSVRLDNTLRHFFWDLPVLRPLPAVDTPFYKIPAIRNFYAGIVRHDLERRKWNKFALLSFYKKKGNDYLFNFLDKHYPPMP